MPFQLQILHASDLEAGIPAINDAPRFTGVFKALQNQDANKDGKPDYPNTIIVSSGDTFIPGPFFSVAADPSLNSVLGAAGVGRADIAIMNATGFQAVAFGNHDFDLGTATISSMIAPSGAYPGAKFAYVADNLDFSGDANLKGRVVADGQEASTIQNKIAKTTVITVGGQKIGIVGATTPQLPVISSPGPGVKVSPTNSLDYDALAGIIQKDVDNLTAQGINKIVLLAHMQELNIEQTLAGKLKDVDVIVAGGSHQLLPDTTDYLRVGDSLPADPNLRYPIVKTGSDGKPVLVVNTAANYSYVGRLVTTFDDNGVIDLKSLDPVVNGAYATDDKGLANVGGTVDPTVKGITDVLAKVLVSKDANIAGSTSVFLNGTRDSVRTEETNLGDLTADANLYATRLLDPTVSISLKNGGGIRDNIGAVSSAGGSSQVQKLPPPANPLANKLNGQVSQLDVENSLRFNNGLAMVTLTADQLKQVLEWGVASTGPNQTPGVFPQISGMSFSYDITKAARTVDATGIVTNPGQRIQTLAIADDQGKTKDILVQGGALQGDPNRTYRMVALDFNILPGTYTDTNANGKWDPTEAFRQGAALGQGGGDGYPFPVFIADNPTRANLVTLVAPGVTKDYNTPGTEQKAFGDYMKFKYPNAAAAFNLADTPASGDLRIQNLSVRQDNVIRTADLVSTVTIPGNATDLFPLNGATATPNLNRLGGFGSDLFYDYRQNVYYALADRGPGGGVIPYQTRVQQFSLNIDPATGKINDYKLLKTIPFTIPAGATLNGTTYTAPTPFNGLNPKLLNGDGSKLGLSQDPEGFVVGANGNFFISDEYGPSVYEFTPTGSFVRAFTQPDNVIPKNGTTPNFGADGSTVTTGRQDNRGYEGLAISPDGTKLFAMLQDPLQNEGSPDGRRSPYIRIVRFDVATGKSDAQYLYQLENLTDINNRIPGTADDFGATSQGRNIGISSLTAINNQEFLVIERDNRGVGVGDATGTAPIGSKRVYKINLTGATDVSNINLTGTNTLPTGVTPVSKSFYLDIASAIQNAGQKVPEKFEGLTIGPRLSDGTFSLVLATDNDFSVTQDGSNTQFDVYTNGVSSKSDVPIGGAAPTAPTGQPPYTLIPSYFYSFKTQANDVNPTPLFDFNVANLSVTEGANLGFSSNATIKVNRTGSVANTDTVQLQLTDGTAVGGSLPSGVDFKNTPITVTFNPGETSKDVLIPIAGDLLNEPDETVNLKLANPSTGTLVGTKQPTSVLTIQNFAVNGLPNGVASGDTTQNSTVLWTRSINPGTVTFEYSTKADFSTIAGRATANVTNALQPVKVAVTGLAPNTDYFYRATDAKNTTASGKFSTAAASNIQAGLRFGVAGDWRGELSPYPAISNAPARNLKFFLEFGDTIYADYPSPALRNIDGTEKAQAETLEDFRIKQSEVYSSRYGKNTWGDLRASTSVLATIDDHEVTNDFAGGAPVNSDPRFGQFNSVMIISVDGLRQADLADPKLQAYLPNIANLQKTGITYTNSSTPTPTDSFPGTLAYTTGASPKTTGVYYDASYDRTLKAPGSSNLGTEVLFDGAASKDNSLLNGGGNSSAASLDVSRLPVDAKGNPVYPHNYLKVNTIFEVAKDAGLRTAYAEKHPAYDLLNGPSGKGVDDLYTPEIDAKVAIVNGQLVDKSTAPAGTTLASVNKSVKTTELYDNLKVNAVINEINGLTSTGKTYLDTNNNGSQDANEETLSGAPNIYGMNFQAVSVAQKLPGNGIATDGTPSAGIIDALQTTDASIGKIIDNLKQTNQFDNTLVVVTAKHGQNPRLGAGTLIREDAFTAPLTAAGIVVAHNVPDNASLIWLQDPSKAAQAKDVITKLNNPNVDKILIGSDLIAAGFADPLTDNRAPSLQVVLKPGVVMVGNPASPSKVAEHGGSTDDETKIPLILSSGGLATAAKGTTNTTKVSNQQIAVTALDALGIDASKLQGAKAEGTTALPGTSINPKLLINDSALYENGLQAFQEYNPINDKFYGATGDDRTANERQLYRYNTFGSDAATFTLEARSFRDQELPAVANPTDATQVGTFLAKSFDPSRTLLGRPQVTDLKNDLLKAEKDGITWKFIMMPEPIQNLGVVGASDRYEGYAAERTEILKYINDNQISNVVFVTADIHGTVVNNLTYQTAPGQAQIATSAFEISTGSVAFDAPFGQTVAQLAASAGLLTADQKKIYDALPIANDADSVINDKDDFIKNLVNQQIKPFGYDPIGLNDNLAQANGLINAKLLQGDYIAAHTYGWSEFNIDQQTQKLTVTTYGVDAYTRAELEANPTAITSRQPKIVSQFEVTPNAAVTPKLTKSAGDDYTINIKGGSGKPKLQVNLTGRNSNLVNELGVFTVDDPSGKIDGIAPGAANYTDAALKRARIIFSAISNVPNGFSTDNLSRLLEFNSGESVRFYLVKNSTTDAVRSGAAPTSSVIFSDPTTAKITDSSDGSYTVGFKDGSNNATDFNNLAVKVQSSSQALPLGTNTQGKSQGEVIDLRGTSGNVKADFTVNREAAHNNFVGFYQVVDENGGIDTNGDGKVDINPGQAGYAEAAVRGRVAGIDLTVGNQATANFTGKQLAGGGIFAPFLISDSTVDRVLGGQTDRVYFAYLGANTDKVDHVRLLANNTFGFEDIAGGGDFDYNDVIVKVNLTV